jgi:hypothetical protein
MEKNMQQFEIGDYVCAIGLDEFEITDDLLAIKLFTPICISWGRIEKIQDDLYSIRLKAFLNRENKNTVHFFEYKEGESTPILDMEKMRISPLTNKWLRLIDDIREGKI